MVVMVGMMSILMNNGFLIILLSFMMICSCSSNVEKRVELLETELGLDLPSQFEIVQDDDVTLQQFPLEYRISMTLRFTQVDYGTVVMGIRDSPYFNQLADYRNVGLGIPPASELQQIMDSLKACNYRGSWVTTEQGFEFVDFLGPETMRPVKAWIIEKNRTLTFEYMNI